MQIWSFPPCGFLLFMSPPQFPASQAIPPASSESSAPYGCSLLLELHVQCTKQMEESSDDKPAKCGSHPVCFRSFRILSPPVFAHFWLSFSEFKQLIFSVFSRVVILSRRVSMIWAILLLTEMEFPSLNQDQQGHVLICGEVTESIPGPWKVSSTSCAAFYKLYFPTIHTLSLI